MSIITHLDPAPALPLKMQHNHKAHPILHSVSRAQKIGSIPNQDTDHTRHSMFKMPVSTTNSDLRLFIKQSAKYTKQRILLKGLLILTCLSLAIHGHEAGRRRSYDVVNQLEVAAWQPTDSASNITAFVDELGPQLSPEASITLFGSDDFENLTERWTAWAAPSFKAAVQVYTEEDVSNTVNIIDTSAAMNGKFR